ncbi:MAG: hypothetical protein MUE53_08730 [Chitinophagales bacterium]|jgi:hypothetical protein|nr:hypothetical protein [Chitinophagales bacterium]
MNHFFLSFLIIVGLCIGCQPKEASPDTKSSVENQIPKELIGQWFTPHAASQYIIFKENGNFVFYDIDSATGKNDVYNGTYSFAADSVTIVSEGRPNQTFSFSKDKEDTANYYLKNAVNYMVKSDDFASISWEEMIAKINEAKYQGLYQMHDKTLTLKENDGKTYMATQPEIDAYLKILEVCKNCPKVPIASE